MRSWKKGMTAAVLVGCIAAACGDTGPTGPTGPTDGTKPTTPTGTTPNGPGTGNELENVAGVYHGTVRTVETLSSGGNETADETVDYCEAVVQEDESVGLVRFEVTGRLQTNGDWDNIEKEAGEWIGFVLESGTWVRTRDDTLEGEIIAIGSTLTFRFILGMTRSDERCPDAEIAGEG